MRREPTKPAGVERCCRLCGKNFYSKNKLALFCSPRCHYDHRRKFGPRGSTHPDWKPKVECTCGTCGRIFFKYPSRTHEAQGGKADYCSIYCNIVNVHNLKERTGIEVATSNLLKASEIEFDEQVALYERWIVDFVVWHWNLIIFCDGNYWHSRPEAVTKDRKQDAYLAKCGWNVLRLTETEINGNLTDCLRRIMSFRP